MRHVTVDCVTGETTVKDAPTFITAAEAEAQTQREQRQNVRSTRLNALREKVGNLTPAEVAEAVDLLLGRNV